MAAEQGRFLSRAARILPTPSRMRDLCGMLLLVGGASIDSACQTQQLAPASGAEDSAVQATAVPLLPGTGEPAVLALWIEAGTRVYLVGAETTPVRVAVWRDRSIVWSANEQRSFGQPYLAAQLTPEEYSRLMSSVRAALVSLPRGETCINSVPDGSNTLLYMAAEGPPVCCSWFGSSDTERKPEIRCLLEAIACIESSIPRAGSPARVSVFSFGPGR